MAPSRTKTAGVNFTLTPERWQHVKQVLQSALELDPERQVHFVASACVGDEPLRREVESLLAYQQEGANFIEVSAVDVAAKVLAEEEAHSAIGRRIGPYKVVREIGHGGMGSVYLAARDDAHYQQRVALKVVKRGMDTDFILRRFRHERQILADLNHPNIARLLDGGTTDDGLPYFVMEYVEGVPIDQHAEGHELTTVERLKLFSVACAAVHYAHQHLVVHRDIKPGNILVTADGNLKLLDFGIAKLLHHDHGSPATIMTATAVRLMTPEYASPEQVRGLSVSTATDIYSLGVLLYEILTGHHPYRFEGRLPHEVAQVICEREPEKPSHAVSRAEVVGTKGGGRATLSAGLMRKTEDGQPEKLRRSLRGDLDNIVLMAMRKEPERRYASVEQFAEDIRRHLEGLPVRARADTFGYRAGKFVTRHKLGVTAAGLILMTLLAGIVATTWQARVARLERERAERRFNEVRQLANSFVFDVHDEIQNLPGSTKARALIAQQALKYLDSLAQEAGGDLTLQRELAAAYEKLGVVQNTPTVAHLGDMEGALQSHRKAATLREALVAADPGNLDYRRDLLDSHWFIASLLNQQGDLPRSLEMSRQQLAVREQLINADPTNLIDRYNQAGTHTGIGETLLEMGDATGALNHQRQALSMREALAAIDSMSARARRSLTISYEHLGIATEQAGDSKGALELQRRGLETRESLLTADPLNNDLRLMLIESHRYVGDLLAKSGDPSGSMENYRKQLTLNEEMVAADAASVQFRSNQAVALIKVGDALLQNGKAGEALSNYRRALQIRNELAISSETDVFNRRDLAESYLKVGDALALSGDLSGAIESSLKGVEMYEALSAITPANVRIQVALANSYLKTGRLKSRVALTAKASVAQKVDHWRAARGFFQQCYDTALAINGRAPSAAYWIESEANALEALREEIKRCDEALTKLQR